MVQKAKAGGRQQDSSKASEIELLLNKLLTKCFLKASQRSSCETLPPVRLYFFFFSLFSVLEKCVMMSG